MPADWRTLFGPHGGTVRFSRRFQWPTNLEPNETAWLVFDGVAGRSTASLNDEPLGAPFTGSAFEITGRLRSSNLLAVEVSVDAAAAEGERPAGLFGTVALEIRTAEEERVSAG